MLNLAPKQLLNTEENGLRYCMKAAPVLKLPRSDSGLGQFDFHLQTPSAQATRSRQRLPSLLGKRAEFMVSGAFCAECCHLMATLLLWSKKMSTLKLMWEKGDTKSPLKF